MRSSSILTALAGATLAGTAQAGEVIVDANITVDTTWSPANGTYNLDDNQIYVMPGASLTIEAGTIIATTTDAGGSLAVAPGGDIFVKGTKAKPVIMTSKRDQNSWVGGNPQAADGAWEAEASEWGNLTLMGNAYISEDATAGNTPDPDPGNVAAMEGLLASDGPVLYGGGDDDDDSGSIRYLSLRYGGRVTGQDVELNGLSLGGIGRGTDISYVEIMNNVDDGIEIWGGTVEIDHVSIWNVGDDSLDVDQGWRGRASHGLIVQGYSTDEDQGSGVGDNGLELDGAEDSDYQPVTTTVIEHFTVIGQPVSGDGLTAWRDGARVQFHDCIFMDGGEAVVRFDNDDGDGGSGYGHNDTLTWEEVWDTPYTEFSTVNAPPNPGDFYTQQTSGNLAEIRDSVFFRNLNGSAYTEANARGVFDAGNNNVLVPGSSDVDSPIRNLVRGPDVSLFGGSFTIRPVISLDPRPQNDALAGGQPAGAFPVDTNWLCGWSAADAYGFIDAPDAALTLLTDAANLPGSFANSGGLPTIGNGSFGWTVDNPTGTCGVNPGSAAFVFTSLPAGPSLFPVGGCTGGASTSLIDFFNTISSALVFGVYTGAPTTIPFPVPNKPGLCGVSLSSQVLFITNPTQQVRMGNGATYTLGE